MEFPFEVQKILPGRITVIENRENNSDLKIFSLDFEDDLKTKETCTYHTSANSSGDVKFQKKNEIELIIDQLGRASANAQGLHDAVTIFKKLLNSNQQKIYIMRDVHEPRFVIGLLKIGIKRLFISDDIGAHHEVDPLCLLDFYIHESKQRCGFGFELFSAMICAEKISPVKLAIDRPSFKCLAFLEKHYGLKHPIVQANNFVIFPGFFQDRPITRPPIFLYNGKGTLSSKCSLSHSVLSKKVKNEIEALDSVQIPFSSKLKVSNKIKTSAESCLKWNADEGDCGVLHEKKHQKLKSYLYKQDNTIKNKFGQTWGVHDALHSYSPSEKESNRSDLVPKQREGWDHQDAEHNCSSAVPRKLDLSSASCSQKEQTWGVYDAMHSYAFSREGCDDWNANNCLTPVNNTSNYSQRARDQLQSSWNILGIKSVNYPYIQKQT